MTIWRDDVVSALQAINGAGSLADIYKSVKNVRAKTLPREWRAIVRRELEYNSSDSESYQGNFDYFRSVEGIGGGVWALRDNMLPTLPVIDLEKSVPRIESVVFRILRDTNLTRQIKALYNNECQICRKTVKLANNCTYSEAHHVKPLGSPHNGPDAMSNILVLCPNHHVQCDYGAVKLVKSELIFRGGHKISDEFISYHNQTIVVN